MKKLRRLSTALWLAMLIALMSGTAVFAASINLRVLTLTEGYSYQLKMKGVKKAKVKWRSTNKKVASVTKNGKVTGKTAGNATIIAKVGKKNYKCAVKVQPKQTTTVTVTKKVQVGGGGAAAATNNSTANSSSTASTASTASTNVKNKSQALTPAALNNGLSAEESAVLSTLLSFKSKYPEGMNFTNAIYYKWKGGIYRGGYGCAAFCFELSDAAFGGNTSVMHYNWDDIRVGDILRVDYNTHSVIVLKSDSSGVTVAEANYNNSVHWGRIIPKSELLETGTNIITRYDTETYTDEEAYEYGAHLPDLMDYK